MGMLTTMNTVFYLAGIGMAGGALSILLHTTGASGVARLVDTGLIIIGVALTLPLISDLFRELEAFIR